MTRDAAMAHLDTYLEQVRRQLRGLSLAETREVLEELRAHVLDRVEGQLTPRAVEAALDALGSPREVARINATERVAAVMEADRSPFGVLRAVGRLATLSAMGFVVFMVSLFGYGVAAGFLISAVLKPFDPQHVGLWRMANSTDSWDYSLGVRWPIPPGAQELLGWWIIPVGLLAAAAIGYLTWRFGVVSVRAMARAGRRGRGLGVQSA